MTAFKDEWDLGMALEVLHSETVDGKLWSEAVDRKSTRLNSSH